MAEGMMARINAKQQDLDALVDEVGRLEVDVLRITQANAAIVEALNNTWGILDRLTGRKPDLLPALHHHTWKHVREATFLSSGTLLGYGVTESCPCGAVRSRMTSCVSLEEFES